ncbi:MAG: ArsC/Spx/MgsR family protein [Patulibacter sp.]
MASLSVVDTTPTLYHDPASAESEFALEALQLGCRHVEVRRIDLPSSAPSAAELERLAARLIGDPVDALVRRGARYERLGLQLDGADQATVLDVLAAHPELLQVPLLDDGRDVMIGQPLERAEVWAITGKAADALKSRVSVLRAA